MTVTLIGCLLLIGLSELRKKESQNHTSLNFNVSHKTLIE